MFMLFHGQYTGACYHTVIMNKRSNQQGFTLLELFVVIVCIIIALSVVFFMRYGA